MKAIFLDADGTLWIITACAEAADLTAETAIFAFKVVECLPDPFEGGMIKATGKWRKGALGNLNICKKHII